MTFSLKLNQVLGLHEEAQHLTFAMIALRAIIIFFAVLLMLRVSETRFLAGRNALDKLLGFLLASMLARAINGSEPFFETIAGGFIIVFLHRFLAWAACHSHWIGRLIKGEPEVLVEGGSVKRAVLAKLHLSEHDLQEDLRLKTGSGDFASIERAQMERNGEISVKTKKEG